MDEGPNGDAGDGAKSAEVAGVGGGRGPRDDDQHAAAELARGRVHRRFLRPDPGEDKEAFKARLLAAALGLTDADTDARGRVRHDQRADRRGDEDAAEDG